MNRLYSIIFRCSALIILLFLASTNVANAQSKKSTNWTEIFSARNANYYQLKKSFEKAERKSEKEIKRAKRKGIVITESEGFEVFNRWDAHMAPRVYPSGNLTMPSTNYTNYLTWQKTYGANYKKIRDGNWTPLGPVGKPASAPEDAYRTGTGRVNFVRFDPKNGNKIFIGTPDGGIWRSTNGGASWATNADFLPIIGCSDLVIDSSNTQIMYLATGDLEGSRRSIGVFKSTDGGTTWNTTALEFVATDDIVISKLLMDPTDPMKMIVATTFGVYKTSDGWMTYTTGNFPAGAIPNLRDMEFKPLDPNTIYASGTEIYKSSDGGDNWVQVTSGVPSSDIVRIALAVTPAEPEIVYALIGNADSYYKGLYLSTNSGTSFSLRSDNPNILGYETNGSDIDGQAFYDLSIAVSNANAGKVTIGAINHWQSTDSGATWYVVASWTGDSGLHPNVHADIHDLTYLNDITLFSGGDGGVFKSINDGISWADISNNLNISTINKIGGSQTNADLLIAGKQDNGTNLRTGNTWTNIYGGDGGESFVDRTNNNVLFFCYTNGEMYRSDDGGVTNVQITTGIPVNKTVNFYSSFHQDPDNANWIFAGGRPDFYKSINKGGTWTKLGKPPGTDNIIEFAVAKNHHKIIYAIKKDAVSRSVNGGTFFNDITGNLPVGNAELTMIAVSDLDSNQVWVTFSGYSIGEKVYKSLDGGLNWINMSDGLPNIPINTIALVNDTTSRQTAYIGADIGVYFIDTLNALAIPFMTNLPNVAVTDLEINYPTRKLRASTYGRGVWESALKVSAPLSIQTATNFSGKNIGKMNLLEWQFANKNMDITNFEIARSTDGTTFEKIGNVPTTENVNAVYNFEDKSPRVGNNLYRLQLKKSTIFDSYSTIINVPMNNDALVLYPNPANNQLVIDLIEASNDIAIADAQGKILYSIKNAKDRVIINTSNYKNGIYIVEVCEINNPKRIYTVTIAH